MTQEATFIPKLTGAVETMTVEQLHRIKHLAETAFINIDSDIESINLRVREIANVPGSGAAIERTKAFDKMRHLIRERREARHTIARVAVEIAIKEARVWIVDSKLEVEK